MAVNIGEYTIHFYKNGDRYAIGSKDLDGEFVDLTKQKVSAGIYTVFILKNKFIMAEDAYGNIYDMTDTKNSDYKKVLVRLTIYLSTREHFEFCKSCRKILFKKDSFFEEVILDPEEYYENSGDLWCLKCKKELFKE